MELIITKKLPQTVTLQLDKIAEIGHRPKLCSKCNQTEKYTKSSSRATFMTEIKTFGSPTLLQINPPQGPRPIGGENHN